MAKNSLTSLYCTAYDFIYIPLETSARIENVSFLLLDYQVKCFTTVSKMSCDSQHFAIGQSVKCFCAQNILLLYAQYNLFVRRGKFTKGERFYGLKSQNFRFLVSACRGCSTVFRLFSLIC